MISSHPTTPRRPYVFLLLIFLLLSTLAYLSLTTSTTPLTSLFSSKTRATTTNTTATNTTLTQKQALPPRNCAKTAPLCPPTFLILGAGKSGTSSLYQYLTIHPSGLPGKVKQTHYFKYHLNNGYKWYLQNFPNQNDFLALKSGRAIISGEASPGYLPYPKVSDEVYKRYGSHGVELLVVIRDPYDRAFSSYFYNYYQKALKIQSDQKKRGVSNSSVGTVVTFREFIEAEVEWLKVCLSSSYESKLANKYYNGPNKLMPSTDLMTQCYTGPNKYGQQQWRKLRKTNPTAILGELSNFAFLFQSLIGRGLYGLQLAWWNGVFDEDSMYVVCSSDLKKEPGETMLDVGRFMNVGMGEYETELNVWKNVTSVGEFNVGGKEGYDKATKWGEESSGEDGDKSTIKGVDDDIRMLMKDIVEEDKERLKVMKEGRLIGGIRYGGFKGEECKW